MEGRCSECNNHNVALHHYQTHLCYNCYEKLFTNAKIPNPFGDEEPDFVLESEVAAIKQKSKIYFVNNGEKIYLTLNSDAKLNGLLANPKRMVFNPDARVKDYDKLIVFLLDNMTVYENTKGFDKVRYMFKEAE